EHGVIPDNFPAQQAIEIVLQRRQALRKFLQLCKVNGADFAVFQGKRAAGMFVGTDRVQAEHLAGDLKTGDLLTPID
ncbi:hypothetical protein O6455_25040, partial [Salmonella enterica subsp. enterica]